MGKFERKIRKQMKSEVEDFDVWFEKNQEKFPGFTNMSNEEIEQGSEIKVKKKKIWLVSSGFFLAVLCVMLCFIPLMSQDQTPTHFGDDAVYETVIEDSEQATIIQENPFLAKISYVSGKKLLKTEDDSLVFVRTDGITVNWDSSIFTFEAGSFYSYDKVLIQGVESKKLNESTVPDLAQQGGIGYSAVLGVHVDSSTPMGWARGTATFNILPTNPIYQSSSAEGGAVTSINVNYAHDKTPIFGSISFSYAGMGVTINAPIFNDNSSASLNFYYKK